MTGVTATTVTADQATAVAVGFGRALRERGVDADPQRVQRFVAALAELDAGRRQDLYWAGRLTLCGSRDELDRYDRAFVDWFGPGGDGFGRVRARRPGVMEVRWGADTAEGTGTEQRPAPPVASRAGRAERLRHRDIAALGPAEREELRVLLASFRLDAELRRSARHRPARRGPVDPRRTVRELLRHGGEPARLRHRSRAAEPRRILLLVDVSGSMAPYADALLRFAHAAARRPGRSRVEVFTLGTRATRITRELTHRHPDTALAAVSRAVPDWSGGTRLGETLRTVLDRWGQRGAARGAVAVVLSDGWECGDPALLAAQMRRLRLLAHRVVWANPRKAQPGYRPTAGGMAAALPSVDALVEGHSLAALEHLAAVVRGAVDA